MQARRGGRLPPRPAESAPILVIPAAGSGLRIKFGGPKFLLPINGRPMIDRLIDLYRPHVSGVVLVVGPAAEGEAMRRVVESDVPITVEIQREPTGMLDAILLAREAVARSKARRVWTTWCDQVAIQPATVTRLAELSDAQATAGIILPVVVRRAPYIHFQRDEHARITRVLQRREGDEMPERGEGDAGLFSMSRAAYLEDLPMYARSVEPGSATRERNFLPFIPWMAPRRAIVTFHCLDEMEAVGVNTPEEQRAVESYLAHVAGA